MRDLLNEAKDFLFFALKFTLAFWLLLPIFISPFLLILYLAFRFSK